MNAWERYYVWLATVTATAIASVIVAWCVYGALAALRKLLWI